MTFPESRWIFYVCHIALFYVIIPCFNSPFLCAFFPFYLGPHSGLGASSVVLRSYRSSRRLYRSFFVVPGSAPPPSGPQEKTMILVSLKSPFQKDVSCTTFRYLRMGPQSDTGVGRGGSRQRPSKRVTIRPRRVPAGQSLSLSPVTDGRCTGRETTHRSPSPSDGRISLRGRQESDG